MAHSEPEVNVLEEKRKVISDIKRYAERYEPEKVEHILLIGRSGVGKSGVVNTIAKVVNGEYFPLVEMGSGETQSKTLELIRLDNCGRRRDLTPSNIEDECSLYDVLDKLPHITDFSGLGNVDNDNIYEACQYLVEGKIPPRTAFEAIEKHQLQYGSLSSKYDTPHEEWKVTKVVFVQGCMDQIPERLIRCLLRALSVKDGESDAIKYTGGIHLLITKYDCVESSFSVQPVNTEAPRDTLSMEEFEKVEKELAGLFSIKGNLEFKRTRWVNYCDQTGFDNEHIDLIALRFLRKMLLPTADYPSDPPETPCRMKIKQRMIHVLNRLQGQELSGSVLYVIAALLVVCIAILLLK